MENILKLLATTDLISIGILYICLILLFTTGKDYKKIALVSAITGITSALIAMIILIFK